MTQIKPINCIFLLALVLYHFFSYHSAKHEYLAAASKYFCVTGSYLCQGFAVQDGAAEKANSRTPAPACTGACRSTGPCPKLGGSAAALPWNIILFSGSWEIPRAKCREGCCSNRMHSPCTQTVARSWVPPPATLFLRAVDNQ